jgi:plastocyanin
MSTQTLGMIRCSLFVVLIQAVFLASGTRADTVTVGVGQNSSMAFSPSSVTIAPGDTVEWQWYGVPPPQYGDHSVTAGTYANPTTNVFNSGVHRAPYVFFHTFKDPGNYPYFCQVHTTMMTGVVHVAAPSPTPGGSPSILGNIATRLRVETGDNVLIGGFIITGTQQKRIILRAIGPSLPLAGFLADPILELRDASGGLLAQNDNWRSTQEAEIIATTIPPINNLESAIVTDLTANNSAYTAIVRGANDGTGIGVVEVYDLNPTADSKLANISTRGLVQTDDNVLIGGLIVLGQNPLRVIVRAIGPSLPLGGALADPTLEMRDSNGALVASNNNWRTDQESEINATWVAPTNNLEAAIVRELTPGNYTAIVRGANNTTGIAVVEAYGLN